MKTLLFAGTALLGLAMLPLQSAEAGAVHITFGGAAPRPMVHPQAMRWHHGWNAPVIHPGHSHFRSYPTYTAPAPRMIGVPMMVQPPPHQHPAYRYQW